MRIVVAFLLSWIVISFVLGPLLARWLSSRSARYAVPPFVDVEPVHVSPIIVKVHGEGTTLYGAAEDLHRSLRS